MFWGKTKENSRAVSGVRAQNVYKTKIINDTGTVGTIRLFWIRNYEKHKVKFNTVSHDVKHLLMNIHKSNLLVCFHDNKQVNNYWLGICSSSLHHMS